MEKYTLSFELDWDIYFCRMDTSEKRKIWKKILQLETEIRGRHLNHGLPYFVEECGGYRIAYKSDETAHERKIFFVGSHKEYEKWYQSA